jgi:hypothetical protein
MMSEIKLRSYQLEVRKKLEAMGTTVTLTFDAYGGPFNASATHANAKAVEQAFERMKDAIRDHEPYRTEVVIDSMPSWADDLKVGTVVSDEAFNKQMRVYGQRGGKSIKVAEMLFNMGQNGWPVHYGGRHVTSLSMIRSQAQRNEASRRSQYSSAPQLNDWLPQKSRMYRAVALALTLWRQ